MKHLSNEAVEYMERVWGLRYNDEVDDIAMFYSCGEYEMVAKRLVEAGAVEPNCKEAKEMIRVARSIKPAEAKEIVEKCLKTHTILECTKCNGVHFIPHEWCDVNDWIKGKCDFCHYTGGVKKVS